VNPAQLDTDRLVLRQWTASDRRPFAALNADPAVMEHFPATLSRVESDAFADRIVTRLAERGWGLWAVEVRGGESFVGFVGLNPVPAILPVAGEMEIGWRLAASAWGRGLATEAAQAVVTHARQVVGLPELVSFTATTNTPSAAVMRRIGMTYDGTFEHPRLSVGHRLREHVLYRLPLT